MLAFPPVSTKPMTISRHTLGAHVTCHEHSRAAYIIQMHEQSICHADDQWTISQPLHVAVFTAHDMEPRGFIQGPRSTVGVRRVHDGVDRAARLEPAQTFDDDGAAQTPAPKRGPRAHRLEFARSRRRVEP